MGSVRTLPFFSTFIFTLIACPPPIFALSTSKQAVNEDYSAAVKDKPQWKTYISKDDFYSVDYPASYNLKESPNAFGGVDLKSYADSYLLTTMVIPNYLEENVRTLYQRLLSQVNQDGWTDIYSKHQDNWLIISGKRKGDFAYTKFFSNGETNVGYLLVVPELETQTAKSVSQNLIDKTVNTFAVNWQFASRYLNSQAAGINPFGGMEESLSRLGSENIPATLSKPMPSLRKGGRQAQKLDAEEIFEKVSQSVWMVISKQDNQIAQGSAVAIGKNHLLTNCHILKTAQNQIINTLVQPKALNVRLHSVEKDSDRCVLYSPKDLPAPVNVRSYANLKIGEKVYTIGAPQNLSLTIAEGLLSAKRMLNKRRYLQTSAPISEGSSGGGLFDSYGNLIGITSLIMSSGQNINFAIPAGDFWDTQ